MGVRSTVCDGCFRRCRYADFVVGDRQSYLSTKIGLEREAEEGIRTGSRRHITRKTVLGKLYETKMGAFNAHAKACSAQGETLPRTVESVFEWIVLLLLRPVDVRVALGMSRHKARKMKTALKAKEIAAYAKKIYKAAKKAAEQEQKAEDVDPDVVL